MIQELIPLQAIIMVEILVFLALKMKYIRDIFHSKEMK